VKWLAELARDSGKPIMLTHHLRKRGLFDTDIVTIDRLRGASAIVQPARIVWALDVPDPGDKETKRLAVVKSNLARFPEPVGVKWSEDMIGFADAPEVPQMETVAGKAMDLLTAILEREPLPYHSVENEFQQAGISKRTLERAKIKLGVISTKKHDGWYWGLPARDKPGVN
jgi:hypothetical protein